MSRIRLLAFAATFIAVAAALDRSIGAQSPAWTSVGPIPRFFHSTVLDPNTGKLIVFGGNDLPATGIPPLPWGSLNDVWRSNANFRWTLVKTKGTPPSPRSGQSTAYDPVSNRMIVFGGSLSYTFSSYNDTWVLTNANGQGGAEKWIQLTPTGPLPRPRFVHGSAYDQANNRFIVFGGDDCSSNNFCVVLNDVWVLSNANGLGGTPTWTELFPTGGGPGPRETMNNVAFDPGNNRLIVFGGTNGAGTNYNEVWVLSDANGLGGTPAWTLLSPSGTPPAPRSFSSSVYDPASNRLTMFGGRDASNVLFNDVWVLSDANGTGGTSAWLQVTGLTSFPEARTAHTAIYDATTNEMIVLGGSIISDFSLATNNVWILGHANGL
ncbi:MAG TPA: kelch repeat-containing protein [Vicinamibacterales bacterium]|nr:kelch repeat-containing protein [Vicinamibacterales bacterium]